MANQVEQASDDKTIEKAVWHYIAVTVLWISLFLFGVVMERLGMAGLFLPESVFSGETGAIRAEAAECQSNFATVKLERDICKRSEDTLRTEISRLKAANTPAP